jgi:hypothetical protein
MQPNDEHTLYPELETTAMVEREVPARLDCLPVADLERFDRA